MKIRVFKVVDTDLRTGYRDFSGFGLLLRWGVFPKQVAQAHHSDKHQNHKNRDSGDQDPNSLSAE